MATYRLDVSAYSVNDDLEVEITGMVQVQVGATWEDLGEVTVVVPATELKAAETPADLANVVRRYAAQLPLIRKQRVNARLEGIVPSASLPVNVDLGEL